jgi:hypothetical protein
MDGARVGQGHRQAQTHGVGPGIDAGQQEGVGFLGIDSECAPFRRKSRSDQPVRIEARQINREPCRAE